MATEIQQTAVRTALLEFPWHDYGLDMVEDAEPDWAEHAAKAVSDALTKIDGTHTEMTEAVGRAATNGGNKITVEIPHYEAVMYDQYGDLMTEEYYDTWKAAWDSGTEMDGPDEIAVVTGSAKPADARAPGSYFLVDKVVEYDVISLESAEIDSRWQQAKWIARALNHEHA